MKMAEELKLRRIHAKEVEKLHNLLADSDIGPQALVGLPQAHEGVDCTHLITDQRNIILICEDAQGTAQGALIFHWQELGIYEVHTMAKREVRGKAYIRAVWEALRTVFLCDTCMEIWTRVPRDNKAALGLVRLVRGRRMFESNGSTYYVLHWLDWLWGHGECSGESLIKNGRWFHARLEQQFAELGRAHEHHEDNRDHDRAVGAACELVLNGLVEKGIILYNRWARLAGYAEASIIVPSPLVINIGSALLQVNFAQREFLVIDASPDDVLRGMTTGAKQNVSAPMRAT
jgi:hypothetical protein